MSQNAKKRAKEILKLIDNLSIEQLRYVTQMMKELNELAGKVSDDA